MAEQQPTVCRSRRTRNLERPCWNQQGGSMFLRGKGGLFRSERVLRRASGKANKGARFVIRGARDLEGCGGPQGVPPATHLASP